MNYEFSNSIYELSYNFLFVQRDLKINNDTLLHYWKIVKYALVNIHKKST
jgi:hypothetical protein